ncbi:hypothetical protein Tco_1251240 [Tanacetum coccineum]
MLSEAHGVSLQITSGGEPYREWFGAFLWRIPILVTVLKTVLRHSKLFEGFKVQLGEDLIQARRGGLQAGGEEMDFRSFMIQVVDGEFNFLPEGEFPSAKELKDVTDCHWVVAHVTPPS